MSNHDYTKEEIARQGREIYDREIRRKVEGDHDGEFLVVDITSGRFSMGQDSEEAFEGAEEENPEGVFYLMRVGRKAAHRIGSSAAFSTAFSTATGEASPSA